MDDPDSFVWLLLKDLGDVDLGLHLVANLVGDGLKDVFKLEVILVDVPGDGPNELQAGQKRGKGLLDDRKLTHMDVLELSGQGVEELDEVFGLGMILLEKVILLVIVVKLVAISLLGVGLHDVDDLLDLGHIQLLIESVEGCASLSPVLDHALSGLGLVGLGVLSVNCFFDDKSPLFL